jgi:nitrite reductase (cytochrome c-552)
MPYTRVGASKVTDHHVRSPLLNVSRACLQCHHFSEQEMIERVTSIQDKTKLLLDRGEQALLALFDEVKLARERGATDEDLKGVFALQRKAQFRLDYISAENSMGFHAPQEAARILAEAIDYARQGQAEARGLARSEAMPS